jgi:very-short-patch-repair endonuclease/predicted transcriptional regulator of viral defense system
VGRLDAGYRNQDGPPPVDVLLARHAAALHAVASTAELRALGLSAGGIHRRVRNGRLHPIHRGVFAIGHPRLTREGRWRAAVLACGPDAALSVRAAGALWRVRPSSRARIDVTTPHRGRRGPAGIDLHRVRRLAPEDVTVVDGIPVTTLARTLVDLAEVVDEQGLARAVHEAEVLRIIDVRAVRLAIARANGRRRVGALAAVLDRAEPVVMTRSELERRMHDLCRAAGLPRPLINEPVEGFVVDFLWRDARLIVETDGAATHLTRRAFEADRARDVQLTLAGYRVVRFTFRQVRDEPERVAAALRGLLSGR